MNIKTFVKALESAARTTGFSVDSVFDCTTEGDTALVLYYSKDKNEYIVHRLYYDKEKESGYFESGDYCRTLEMARAAFRKRSFGGVNYVA